MKYLILIMIAFLLAFTECSSRKNEKEETKRPNVMIILMDDMGYSDLGFMGSEIETPNIDKLAANGLFYNQFYNTGRCCPTRASLLTGQYPHATGMGWMTASDLGRPAYTGDINNKCITIAQALGQNDYKCYMTGKWHVTHDSYMKPEGPKHNWPIQRGFDRFYGHLTGGGGFFKTKSMLNDNEWLGEMPDGFYLTSAVTDSTVAILEDHFSNDSDNPFFFYVAYYAPHRPLHALKEDIEKYEGKFMQGWDTLRIKKYQKMVDLGIINPVVCPLTKRDAMVKAWDTLSDDEKVLWDKRMAIYAAQIDRADQGIGKILETLKKNSALDNTLIMFLSDNGGNTEAQGGTLTFDQLEKLGLPEGRDQSYRREWANMSNTPYRQYKTQNHEGGVCTSFIAHWPSVIKSKGAVSSQVAHVIDLFPTILDVTGGAYPDEWNQVDINDLHGRSFASSFTGEVKERGPLFFEHEANRAVRDGNFKLVNLSPGKAPFVGEWELYDLSVDRSETNNIAAQNPEKVKELSDLWYNWANTYGVLPMDDRGWGSKIKANVNK